MTRSPPWLNLGLSSADRLAGEIKRAIAGRGDWSADRVLSRYETGHRRHARRFMRAPTDRRPLRRPARAGQGAAPRRDRVAWRLPFFRGAVRNLLLRA